MVDFKQYNDLLDNNFRNNIKKNLKNRPNIDLEKRLKISIIDRENKEEKIPMNSKYSIFSGSLGDGKTAIVLDYKSKPSSYILFSENPELNSLDINTIQGIKGFYMPLNFLQWEKLLLESSILLGIQTDHSLIRVLSAYQFEPETEMEARRYLRIYQEIPQSIGFKYNSETDYNELTLKD